MTVQRAAHPWISRLSIVLLSSTALVGPGCDAKTRHCREVIGLVDEHRPALETATADLHRIAEEPAVADAFTQAIDELDAPLSGLEIEDETVARFRGDYRELLARTKTIATALQSAVKADDLQAFAAQIEAARQVTESEHQLAEQINAYCGSGS